MYRAFPLRATGRTWPWHYPEAAATLAFVIGTLASAPSLGIAARTAEDQGYATADVMGFSAFVCFTVLATVVPAFTWGSVIRIALALRRGFATALVVLVAGAMALLTLFAAMVAGGEHGQSTVLHSALGLCVAILLEPLRLASFGGVAGLVQRVAAADAELGPLDAAAAAWAWAAVWAAIGAVLGPGLFFRAPAVLMLLVASAGVLRTYRLSTQPTDEEDLAQARRRARALILRGFRRGALPLAIGGSLFVLARLPEQILMTRNPGAMAIFRSRIAKNCDVDRGAREGDIRLWVIKCSSGREVVGWDDAAGVLLRGEQLYQRAPRLRLASPAGTGP